MAAYGSGNLQGETALRLLDAEVRRRFPGIPVRWAVTSCLLRERLAVVHKKTDSVRKALRKMHFEKYTHIALQPLQFIPGNEYADVQADALAAEQEDGCVVRVGRPLLSTPQDVERGAEAVLRHLPEARRPDEDVVLMGHGARHPAVQRYRDLAQAVYRHDARVHVGAMNGALSLEEILSRLTPGGQVWLMPLLSLVGGHVLRDMVGTAEHSWRSRLEAAGMRCLPVLKGAAEYAAFVSLWLDHLEEVLREL